MSKNKKNNDAWSNYWSKGFLTTFDKIEKCSYEGDIKQYWENAFSLLKKEGKLIDLGAGNGALLKIAKEFFLRKQVNIEMIAVDYAEISNSEFYKVNSDIEILSNTLIENTGICSSGADFCISQFGFEYASRELAVNELGRILKPGGYFCAILHHNKSITSVQSRSAIEQIQLCQRSELVETVEKLLKFLYKANQSTTALANDKEASTLRSYFNSMASRLIQYGHKLPDSRHIDYFLNELGNLFGSKSKDISFEEKLNILNTIKIESKNYLARLMAMTDSSMGLAEIKELTFLLKAKGIEVQMVKELFQDESIYGWALITKKHKL